MSVRPAHADVDKPHGYGKRKLQRWQRQYIRNDTREQIREYQGLQLTPHEPTEDWGSVADDLESYAWLEVTA